MCNRENAEERFSPIERRLAALPPDPRLPHRAAAHDHRERLAHRQRQTTPRCHCRAFSRGDRSDVHQGRRQAGKTSRQPFMISDKEIVSQAVSHSHKGKALSWQISDGVLELALHLPPCNEIGTAMLERARAVRRGAEDGRVQRQRKRGDYSQRAGRRLFRGRRPARTLRCRAAAHARRARDRRARFSRAHPSMC